jgi:hypothetical protein
VADVLDRAGPTALSSGSNDLLTVAASHRYTLLHVKILNPTSSPIRVKVGIGGVADANLIEEEVSIPPGGSLNFGGKEVLKPTEVLKANCSATGCTATVSYLDQG